MKPKSLFPIMISVFQLSAFLTSPQFLFLSTHPSLLGLPRFLSFASICSGPLLRSYILHSNPTVSLPQDVTQTLTYSGIAFQWTRLIILTQYSFLCSLSHFSIWALGLRRIAKSRDQVLVGLTVHPRVL